ncbi:homeodomain-interacting protein kinase 2-like [Perca fluviatilis]|uniref:homeodomain-interacting protein kinase 2-like n=1 Tax=Perca fluviatilis TaxID=8168 RepID=UPI001965AE24|nr:homeodomain-interacting protein kinase 2-like [Perca fluviatilis]
MFVDGVNKPFKIKIIDFGLARYVSQIESGSYMQPRYYRSPEAILGFPFTTAIDMWSLGCVAAELFLGYVLYPGDCDYDMLQHMVQTQGQLPHELLNNGIKTWCFFRRNRGRRRSWRLKTPFEYGQVTRSESHFNSLNDLKKIRPACHLSNEDTMAESKDQENFVDLLKKMLHLDIGQRITPGQLLEDPFITMCDLANRYPNSFYVKLGCEMMEVCLDQSMSPHDMDQQPWLNLQASTSTASLDQHNLPGQVTPVWNRRQEHPFVLRIASAVSSSLSIQDQSLLQPQQLSFSAEEEMTAPEPSLPSTSEVQIYMGEVSPVRKMKSDSFEALQSGDISLESALTESKRIKTDFIETQAEVPAEASSSTAKAKPQRKRTWDTVVASNSGLRAPDKDSPQRKKMKMNLLNDSKEAPIITLSSEAKIKPQRKRTRATFVASHSGLRAPDRNSPERKKMKIREDPIETLFSEAKIKPQIKRLWDTFVASNSGYRSGSPERKRRTMSLNEISATTVTRLYPARPEVQRVTKTPGHGCELSSAGAQRSKSDEGPRNTVEDSRARETRFEDSSSTAQGDIRTSGGL